VQASYQSPACEIPGLCSPTGITGCSDMWYLTGSDPEQKGLVYMYKLLEIFLYEVENTRCCANVKFYCDFECF